MDTLAALLASFDVSPIFPVIEKIASSVATYLSPVLLIVAIYIRLMETQVDALVSGGKYGTALRDMLIWTFVLGSYFALGNLIIGLFNPIYAWLDTFGSLSSVMEQFGEITDKQFAQNKELVKNRGIVDGVLDIVMSPYLIAAAIFYYGTLIMLAFLTAFLKIAMVMVFGVAFIWGLIAIPISISTTFKILKGWAYLTAFALVWPVIQGLLLAMMSMLLINSVASMNAVPDVSPVVLRSNTMMLFAVLHLLMGAVMVAAPFIANALVTNSSSAAGIVMPFVGAAIAAGAGTAKVLSQGRGQISGSGLLQKNGSSSSPLNNRPQPRSVAASFNTTPTTGADIKNNPAGGAIDSDTPASATPDAAPEINQQKAQRKRGAIIRQQAKKPG